MYIFIYVSLLYPLGWERVYPEITCKVREIKYLSADDPFSAVFALDKDGIGYYKDSVLQKFDYDSLPLISVEFTDSLSDEFLCVMGNGSESDGLYKFSKESGTFSLLLSSDSPNFVRKLDDGKYYFGSKEGLFYSDDLNNWHSLDSLNGKNIFDASYISYLNTLNATDGDQLYIFENDTLATINPDLWITDLFGDYISLKGGSYSDGIYWASKEFQLLDYVFNPDIMGCYIDPSELILLVVCQADNKIYSRDLGEPGGFYEIGKCTFSYDSIYCINQYPVTQDWEFRFFIGTDTGVYMYEDFVGIEENGNDIDDYELNQNYPNPFNSETHITINLEKSSFVELNIFNSKSEIVQNLINEKLNKGNHNIKFKANNINSGIYFYKLNIDGVAKQTRKMLYLK